MTWIGNLAAELWVRIPKPPFVAIDASFGSTHEYPIHTVELTEAETKAFAAAMIEVPKP
jgi:hypothetical protein